MKLPASVDQRQSTLPGGSMQLMHVCVVAAVWLDASMDDKDCQHCRGLLGSLSRAERRAWCRNADVRCSPEVSGIYSLCYSPGASIPCTRITASACLTCTFACTHPSNP